MKQRTSPSSDEWWEKFYPDNHNPEEEKSRKKEKKLQKKKKQFEKDWNRLEFWRQKVPKELKLKLGKDSGFFFGMMKESWRYIGIVSGVIEGEWRYIGKRATQDGHILIVGDPGRGKTASQVIPTMSTWEGIQVIIDVKGNLSDCWKKLNNHKGKKVLVFNPNNPESCHYDPFLFLKHGEKEDLVENARNLALALIPLLPSVPDSVWVQTAQNLVTGIFIYYYELGGSFIDAMAAINELSVIDIIKTVMDSDSASAKAYISKLSGVQEKVIANIGMELSNLTFFTAGFKIPNVLLKDEEHELLDWQKIFEEEEATDVILVIPETRLEQWRPMLLLIINQMIKALEQRRERTYHLENELSPVLILLDEFARLGKISAIKNGLATLRSRGVTFALLIQNLADLYSTYGQEEAKSIMGNCSYKAVLGVTDAESQKYFSELAGNFDSVEKSCNINYGGLSGEATGYSRTMNEARKPIIYPEEFLTMKDVVLFTPNGVCRVNKVMIHENEGMFLPCKEDEECGDISYMEWSE